MDMMIIAPLKLTILLESNTLKSTILVRRLAVGTGPAHRCASRSVGLGWSRWDGGPGAGEVDREPGRGVKVVG